jgi:SAM-dependent methyltransferase
VAHFDARRGTMGRVITQLPDHPEARDPEPFAGSDHPMRRLTRSTAFGEPWTREHAERVTSVFDELAPGWSGEHVDPVKAAPVLDAIDRGRPPLEARWIELGSGTGAGCRVLHGRVREQISVDLSSEMLAHASDHAPRVRADSSRLPFPDDVADVVLLINMLLFPAEVDRILRADGRLVWVNTLGDQTPIHLPAEDVVRALPGDWHGVASRAGTGTWAVVRRR